MSQANEEEAVTDLVSLERIRAAAYNVGPIAQIVVELRGSLALVNEQARSMFGLTPADLGRPFQDLEISYRPVELRSCIERAYA